MLVVVAKLKAKAGEEGKIEKAFLDVLPKVLEEEGTVAYTLNRSQADPTVLMVLEKYKDMDAFAAHGATPHLAELFGVITPLLDGDLALDMYEEIA